MKKAGNIILIIILSIVMFFVGGIFVILLLLSPVGKIFNKGNNETTITSTTESGYNSCSTCKTGTLTVENGGISESVAKAYDSVVMIKIYKGSTMSGSGSGFFYKKDDNYGYIMTNYHVIDGATSIKVKTVAKDDVEAEVLGGDKFLDIAVVRVAVKDVVAVAKIGSTEELKLGETVFAIGTPVGINYFNTVTGGHVSGLKRQITVSVESTSDWVQEVIQIDAAINPGNSGGPLFNFNGEVIGVNSMKLINNSIEGMGFTIKIEDAMKHVSEFEKGKSIERPYLGITYVDVSESAALRYYGIKIDSSIKSGVVVRGLENSSSAAKAGIQKGDVITKINDDNVTSTAFLRYLLYKYNVGDTIKVTINRNGTVKTVEVKLTAKD